ncbi:MAG: hypothetical protein J5956_11460 [Ruminococcus sp.]|nr:hypothetical protein [Ruminococcus sp.]
MIYSKENISIAVEILQNLYHPNYNVPIEVVADAILWEFDEDYEDHHEIKASFGDIIKEEFSDWLSAKINSNKDYISSMEEIIHNNT